VKSAEMHMRIYTEVHSYIVWPIIRYCNTFHNNNDQVNLIKNLSLFALWIRMWVLVLILLSLSRWFYLQWNHIGIKCTCNPLVHLALVTSCVPILQLCYQFCSVVKWWRQN